MVLFKLIDRSVGLVSTIILARVLVPADFGLVALAVAIIGAVELLGAFSFDLALIHRADSDRTYSDTAWTLNILFGLFCAGLLLLLALPAASFYAEPRLAPVIALLAVGLAIQGCENIGIVAFRKELTFHKDFGFMLAKRLIGFAVTVGLALTLRNYWALVIGITTGRLVGVGLSYLLHPYRPAFTLKASRELLHFSRWLILNNFTMFLNGKAADFVIGKLAGAHTLGVFSVAYEISNMPTTELVAPINRAAFPGYAKMKSDLGYLREGYLKVVGMIGLFAIPAAAGIVGVADLLVPVLLGPKWLEAVPLIQVLALYGGSQSLQSNGGTLILAIGRPHLLAVLTGLHLTTLIALLALAVPANGALGAAWAVLGASLVTGPVSWYVVMKLVELRFKLLAAVFIRPLVGALAMLAAVSQVKASLHVGVLPELAICVVVGALGYALVVASLWLIVGRPAGAESAALQLASHNIARWFGPAKAGV